MKRNTTSILRPTLNPKWVRRSFIMPGTRVLHQHLTVLESMTNHRMTLNDMAAFLARNGFSRYKPSTLAVYVSQAIKETGIR